MLDAWALYSDQSGDELDDLIDDLEPLGWVPSRVTAYTSAGQTRYTSLWEQQSVEWYMYFGQTRDEYQTQIDDKVDEFRVVHVDGYTNQLGDDRYAVIFWADPTVAQRIRTDRDWYLHQRNFNNNSVDGYVIENFYATDIPAGSEPANPRSIP